MRYHSQVSSVVGGAGGSPLHPSTWNPSQELRANFNLQKERLDDDAVVEDKVRHAIGFQVQPLGFGDS